MAVAQKKKRYQNGSLVSGNMGQSLRDPSCLFLSHTQMEGDHWTSLFWLAVPMPGAGEDGRACERKVVSRFAGWTEWVFSLRLPTYHQQGYPLRTPKLVGNIGWQDWLNIG